MEKKQIDNSKKCIFHRWKYRNPADRTCKKCGKHEQLFGHPGTKEYDVWEEMVPSTINAPNPYLGG